MYQKNLGFLKLGNGQVAGEMMGHVFSHSGTLESNISGLLQLNGSLYMVMNSNVVIKVDANTLIKSDSDI